VVRSIAGPGDPLVNGPQLAGHQVGVVLGAEHDRVGRLERAAQAAEWVLGEPAVVGDAGRHLRMGQLHEQGPSAAEEEDGLAADLPDDRILGEQSVHRIQGYVSRRPRSGYHYVMGPLGVLFVPAALMIVTVLLF